MILASGGSCSETGYTITVRLRALEETTVATNRIVDSVLRCAMEF